MGSDDDQDAQDNDALDEPRLVERPIALAGAPDESLSAELGSMRHPWWHWVGGAFVLLGLLFVLAVIVPEQRLKSARTRVDACRGQGMEHEVDPSSCTIGPQYLAELSPYTRGGALYLRARSDYEQARHAVYALARTGEGGERREQLLAQLRDTALHLGSYRGTVGRRYGFNPTQVLLSVGALEEGAQLVGLQLDAGNTVDWSQHAVLFVGGGLEHMAKLAGQARRPQNHLRERAAWLCLLGEREAGAALFGEYREFVSRGEYARPDGVRAAACMGTDASAREGPGLERELGYWHRARELARMRGTLDWEGGALDEHQRHVSVLAQSVVHERPSPATLLRWLAPEGEQQLAAWLYPSMRALVAARGELFPPGFPVYDPASMVEAARHMARQVDEANAALAELPGAKPDAAWTEAYVHGKHDARALLAHVAGVMALEAGVEFTARHQFEAAREALKLCLRAAPRDDQFRCAQPLLTAGGRADALAWTVPRRAELGALAQRNGNERKELGRLSLLLLELHARVGEADAVREVLAQAKDMDPRSGWLPERFVQWARSSEAAGAGEAFGDAPIYRFEPELLPRIFLRWSRELDADEVRAAVPRGLEDEQLAFHGQRALWARAELARRWGLVEDEQYWLERLAEVRALVQDEDDWLLLHATGLWTRE